MGFRRPHAASGQPTWHKQAGERQSWARPGSVMDLDEKTVVVFHIQISASDASRNQWRDTTRNWQLWVEGDGFHCARRETSQRGNPSYFWKEDVGYAVPKAKSNTETGDVQWMGEHLYPAFKDMTAFAEQLDLTETDLQKLNIGDFDA